MQKSSNWKLEAEHMAHNPSKLTACTCIKNSNNYFLVRINLKSVETMGIKNMNIIEGEYVFIFEQININFSNNSKKSSKTYELSHQENSKKYFQMKFALAYATATVTLLYF